MLGPEFKKAKLILRQLLIGKNYFNALIAMEFAEKHHQGLRKDGVTPEFAHQIEMALFALTLPDVLYPEELVTTIFLHDTPEDYDITLEEIRALFTDRAFAVRTSDAVWAVTKTFRGVKRNEDELMEKMSCDPIASLVKPVDRNHNLQTMVGVFTFDKQKDYLIETEEKIIPMTKRARRNFPHQGRAYENLKWMMGNQMRLIRAMHQGIETHAA